LNSAISLGSNSFLVEIKSGSPLYVVPFIRNYHFPSFAGIVLLCRRNSQARGTRTRTSTECCYFCGIDSRRGTKQGPDCVLCSNNERTVCAKTGLFKFEQAPGPEPYDCVSRRRQQ
jgi:hypothetical protein